MVGETGSVFRSGSDTYFFEHNERKALESGFWPSFDLPLPSASSLTAFAFGLLTRCSAFMLLLLTSPLMGLCAIAIKATSRGPLFYLQERVGLGGRIFRIVKFRSMIADAEAKTGPVLSWQSDPRVTPIGRWLRNTHLDELPQLFNVLKGEMAFIGPRPERPEFVRRYNREIAGYTRRSALLPGITGLAQVCGGYDASPEEKLRFDLLYAKYRLSVRMNLFIVYNTFRKVFFVRFNQ
jgi:lipopolysaccharide/colanic/teichoic acid biosynthesis glycosyltransferase